jgi:hypothetical protein
MDYELPLLTPADLVDPVGDLLEEDFPKDSPADFEERLLRYIAEADQRISAAAARTPQPLELTEDQAREAEKAWAYHRAYTAICRARQARPTTSMLVDQGSVTYSPAQMAAACQLAAEYEGKFLALVPAPAEMPQAEAASYVPASSSTPIVFGF